MINQPPESLFASLLKPFSTASTQLFPSRLSYR